MVVTNQTPFYGESGGQIGDTGTIRRGPAVVRITDTQKKLGDLHVHIGRLEGGALEVGDVVELAIDGERRARLRRAHSATHLLHAALRRHLGSHVTQKGSLVAPDRLRFDFSHPKAVTPDELAAIEAEVNAFLRQNDAVAIRLMDREAAIAAGAMALFGEKYGDEVRVVSMGREPDGRTTSIELCGGTHCARTGDIALFKITGESAVAAGHPADRGADRRGRLPARARRGAAAGRRRRGAQGAAAGSARARREPGDRAAPARAGDLEAPPAAGDRRRGAEAEAKDIGGIRYLAREVEGVPARDLRATADAMQRRPGLGRRCGGQRGRRQGARSSQVSADLKDAVNAVDLVNVGVAELGGKGGGGRADFAQGGGPDGSAPMPRSRRSNAAWRVTRPRPNSRPTQGGSGRVWMSCPPAR